MNKASGLMRLALGLAALGAVVVVPVGLAAHEGHTSHHHDLRGTIKKVEADRNQFEIETGKGHVVLCLIDQNTTIRRGDKKITLAEVQPGERAHCHCAAIRNDRHYSQSLVVEPARKKRD